MLFWKPQLLAVFVWVLSPGFLVPATPLPAGAWVDTHDSDYLVGIETGRYTLSIGGKVKRIASILSFDGEVLHLCDNGKEVSFRISYKGKDLVLQAAKTGETHRLRVLSEWPEALLLRPMTIPPGMPLPEAKILEIQGELWDRLAADQNALMPLRPQRNNDAAPWLPPPPPPRELSLSDFNLITVQAGNTTFIRKEVAEVGWIDVGRFGFSASNAAFLLVQHSYDLPLMTAVLEAIRRDVEAGQPMGESYALLYDRVHLMLGEKQRYGSQITYDEVGQPLLLPVEKPEKMDELRKAFEMVSIDEYLKVFGGDQVRISSECSALH